MKSSLSLKIDGLKVVSMVALLAVGLQAQANELPIRVDQGAPVQLDQSQKRKDLIVMQRLMEILSLKKANPEEAETMVAKGNVNYADYIVDENGVLDSKSFIVMKSTQTCTETKPDDVSMEEFLDNRSEYTSCYKDYEFKVIGYSTRGIVRQQTYGSNFDEKTRTLSIYQMFVPDFQTEETSDDDVQIAQVRRIIPLNNKDEKIKVRLITGSLLAPEVIEAGMH